jgi:hypothetical protein
MAIVFVNGAVDLSINVYSRLSGFTDGLSPQARGQIEDVIDDLTAELREYIIDYWPVDTRRSQQAWSLQWEAPMWLIRNPVEYAEYVHTAGQGPNPEESWRGVEAESEELLAGALSRLNQIVQRDNIEVVDVGIQRTQNLAERLAAQARRVLRTSLFAATVEAYRARPSRLRERESQERQRLRLRGR